MSDLNVHGLLAGTLIVAWALGGCTAVVGDACQIQTDCGQEMYCESSLPDGYCTVQDCESDGCPDEGVCVVFNQLYPTASDGTAAEEVAASSAISFCMKRCEGDVDCRDGYTCVEGHGPHPFCNDALGTFATE